jgi:hypothetical protein
MSVNYTTSCEIGNLLREVCETTGKSYAEVENRAFKNHIYPESIKTAISVEPDTLYNDWLYDAIREIMKRDGVRYMYITEDI